MNRPAPSNRRLLPARPREAFAVMIAEPYKMQWALKFEDEYKKIAILCTKEDHALMEMLWAVMRKDLKCTVTVVISNHTDLQQPTEALGFKYHHGQDPALQPPLPCYCLSVHGSFGRPAPIACTDPLLHPPIPNLPSPSPSPSPPMPCPLLPCLPPPSPSRPRRFPLALVFTQCPDFPCPPPWLPVPEAITVPLSVLVPCPSLPSHN